MSSGWDTSGASFLMSNSNPTLTEIMDMGFVAAVHGNSSPFSSQPEQWDSRAPPKSGVSPLFVTVSESTPMTRGGGKLWLGSVEDVGSSDCRSPLNPDGQFLEQSLVSESLNQFNNSIVGIFYGSKVSTPYKKEGMETSDPLVVDITIPKLQDSEVVVNASVLQKPAPPVWEISEINSALEENTPSLEVSISDLRFPNISSEGEPLVPAQLSAAPLAQWVGVKHKDIGRSYLQPFRYRRQLSASEIPVTSLPPQVCFQLATGSPDKLVEWQLEVTAGPQAT
ncbi:PREDICTED: uncharacterized protein LOC108791962 [Nanorana parkeri]|uniref:uncharacterized protein LOC108791962 n=1 Tax=Nanorana parkeri TaxID=125878 RepID=UPI0008544A63|nr:PREDICTED: uncharacterized protein LOC108791962 [Nanorana parkeri]